MVKPVMETNKGYTVSGCQVPYDPTSNSYHGVSGRVRVDKNDPSKDMIARWDSNCQPIDHDYGQLINTADSKDATAGKLSGFENIFSGLIASSQATAK